MAILSVYCEFLRSPPQEDPLTEPSLTLASGSDSDPCSDEPKLPDNFTISTPYGDLEQLAFRRHDRDPRFSVQAESLPEGVVALGPIPADELAVAMAFRRALAQARDGELHVESGSGMSIVTVGPLLCFEDRLRVGGYARHGRLITVEIIRTPYYSGQVKPSPRERSWRPLVVVPLLLGPGSYELRAIWRNLEEVVADEPLSAGPLVCSCVFTVPKGTIQSRKVCGHGVEVRAVVDALCHVSRDVKRTRLNAGLMLTNRSGRDLSELSGGFLAHLRALDDHPLNFREFPQFILRWPTAMGTAVDHSHLFLLRSAFEPAPDGTLTLSDGLGSWQWEGASAGRYALSIRYYSTDIVAKPLRQPDPIFTSEVEFEIARE